ncbi:MAG: hypothetical protein U0871_11510 [Gemmataceae bacterium]
MPTYVDSTATGSLVLNGQALGSDHCRGGAIDVRIKLEAVLSPFKVMAVNLSEKDKLAPGAMIRDAKRRGTPKPNRGLVEVPPVERRAYRGGLCGHPRGRADGARLAGRHRRGDARLRPAGRG